MTSRRQVLQIGLTGAALLPVVAYADAWPVQPASALRASAVRRSLGAGGKDRPCTVVFDERFSKSRVLARELAGPFAQLAAIRGDVTALWYHDLYFAWQKRPEPIAGVTTVESLFCLEILARDAGLHVTHRQRVDADLVSWSIGPSARRASGVPRTRAL